MSNKHGKCKIFIHKRIPITSWLPKYDSKVALADAIAGVTVGLTVMPQALAYAALAGLQPQYGLYSSFVGCFVYAIFGSCKDITIGPTALMSLMTYQQVVNRNPDYAILLCFLTGCVMMLMAFLRLGVLVEFISQPVTVGFTTATSVIIIASQIKGLLGLSYQSSGFISIMHKIALNIHNTKLWDAVMGFTCIFILMLLRKLKDIFIVDKLNQSNRHRILSKFLWLLSTSRNALIVVCCSFIAYLLQSNNGEIPFKITGSVRPGIPPVQLPPFSSELGNRTVTFSDMFTDLGSSIILVPIIAVLGNVAIAKAFAGGEPVDATQELFTLALCNLLGSFVSSIPITGSFSRSAVNHASGVKTTLGGIYTGVLLLLALDQLTPYFYFIPNASLAAVIISAVIFMIEYEVMEPMWKASRRDMIPMFATFATCLFVGVEIGIVVGVCMNIALLMIYSAKPKINVEKVEIDNESEYICIKPNSSIYYPGVERLRNIVLKAAKSQLPVVIDCTLMEDTDFTTAKSISSFIKEFSTKDQPFFFYNAQPRLLSVLTPICVNNFVHFDNITDLKTVLDDLIKERIPNEDPSELMTLHPTNKDIAMNSTSKNTTKDCDEPLLSSKVTVHIASN
ncbi:sodium-independent sulfate anion transporter [Rhodnius prolixus]|uniref:sodium-independent sulfate anion transporter n=1 Tax=Rhodnius prolixus TaxID=13249 RepID=UPI003D18AFE5